MTLKRNIMILGSALFIGLSVPVNAQSAQDQVVRQLQKQGYDTFRVSRTLLGRVRIVAKGAPGNREIVLNPATGSILRDYASRPETPRSDGGPSVGQISAPPSASRSDPTPGISSGPSGGSPSGSGPSPSGGRDSDHDDHDDHDGGDDHGGDDRGDDHSGRGRGGDDSDHGDDGHD